MNSQQKLKGGNKDSIIALAALNVKPLTQRDFIVNWNVNNFFDRWWRQKHKIPFGSSEHLNANHVFMSIEYKEEIIFKSLNGQNDKIGKKPEDILTKAGITRKTPKESQEIILTGRVLDDEFEKLDLKDF